MPTWKNVADGLLDNTWSLETKTFKSAGPDGAVFIYVYVSNTGETFTTDNNLVGTNYYLEKKYSKKILEHS
uniref:Uncharacterized protein n=1 Tax=viral metagenome TaxID=1070528 RepID=A0A6C0AZB4_9ZZZZ